MRKSECEPVIRHLLHKWREDCGFGDVPEAELSFSTFYWWMEQKHSNYLTFRTTTSVRYDVEMWFDQEFKQTWRR
jgi:hypothetical protein